MQNASSKQQTEQKYKPSYQQAILPPQTALSIRGKTNKNSSQISPYTNVAETTRPTFRGQKRKGRKNSTLKPGKRRPQTHKLKNNNNKAEKYYTNE